MHMHACPRTLQKWMYSVQLPLNGQDDPMISLRSFTQSNRILRTTVENWTLIILSGWWCDDWWMKPASPTVSCLLPRFLIIFYISNRCICSFIFIIASSALLLLVVLYSVYVSVVNGASAVCSEYATANRDPPTNPRSLEWNSANSTFYSTRLLLLLVYQFKSKDAILII